jgi:hypothetical protein
VEFYTGSDQISRDSGAIYAAWCLATGKYATWGMTAECTANSQFNMPLENKITRGSPEDALSIRTSQRQSKGMQDVVEKHVLFLGLKRDLHSTPVSYVDHLRPLWLGQIDRATRDGIENLIPITHRFASHAHDEVEFAVPARVAVVPYGYTSENDL